jgi:hypothetical protein
MHSPLSGSWERRWPCFLQLPSMREGKDVFVREEDQVAVERFALRDSRLQVLSGDGSRGEAVAQDPTSFVLTINANLDREVVG